MTSRKNYYECFGQRLRGAVDVDKRKVEVMFSSDKLLIVFSEDPCFEGRKLFVKGEALSCGFDAYPSSMKWLKPFEDEKISCEQKKYIIDSVNESLDGCITGFKVIWEEEE